MTTVHVHPAKNAMINEMCRAISFVRQENVFRKLEFPEYSSTLIQYLRRSSGPNAYRYWGSTWLKYELSGEKSVDAGLLQKVLKPYISHASYNDDVDYKKVKAICEDVEILLKDMLKGYDISEVVNISLLPVITCPPPQIGRFGASLRKGQSTAVVLAFGSPPIGFWRDFQLDVSFFTRGTLHYISKEWLYSLQNENTISLKKPVFEHLTKLFPLLLQQEYGQLPCDVDELNLGKDLNLYKWSMQFFAEGFNFNMESLLTQVNKINEEWPPNLQLPNGIPQSIIELIQERTRFYIDDPTNLLENTRWIEDFFQLNEHNYGKIMNRLAILPWDAQEASEVIIRNNLRTLDDHYCILIDRLQNSWQLVLLCPPSHRINIDPVIITQISSSVAYIDSSSGRMIR